MAASVSQDSRWGTQREQTLFSARCDDARILVPLLKAIHFHEEATVHLTKQGVKVITETAKSVQAKVLFPVILFSDYHFGDDESARFRIPLNILLDCLGIFGNTSSETALKLSYNGYGTPLTLMLEEDGVLTEASIQTMEEDEPLDIDVHATEIPCNIIMKSEWLSQVFSDLDVTSETLQIYISPDQPYFRLTTTGETGTTQVECPKDSNVVEAFTCRQMQIFSYKLKLLKPSEKALSISSKISIRVNKWGTLSLQYLVQNEANGPTVFVEYLSLPEILDDGDDLPEYGVGGVLAMAPGSTQTQG